jgi:hypothetical protein
MLTLTVFFFVMLTGMTLAKLMGDLVGLLEVAVEAVAEVTVEAVAQVPRGHAVMNLDVAGLRAGVGAGAGAIETIVLAAVRVAALLLAVGMKRLLLFQDLLGLTRGMQSTKALQDLTLWMTM